MPRAKPRGPIARFIQRLGMAVGLIAMMTTVAALLLHASVETDGPPPRDPDAAGRRMSLSEVKSWGYQLHRTNLGELAKSPFDLIVIDPSAFGRMSLAKRAEAIEKLKRKPDGGQRIVLSYLSIGEAEDYRAYWRGEWVMPAAASPTEGQASAVQATAPATAPSQPSGPPAAAKAPIVTGSTQPAAPAAVPAAPVRVPSAAAPKWLGAENAEWRGNYKVRFWDADWQALLMGKRDAALDRIAASGFDGVYLDRADVFAELKAERPTAKDDMVGLVEKIAGYARRLNPGFLVVLQNAEELMAHQSVRRAIDAIAKEDLLYGINGEGLANDSADVTASLHYLKLAQKSGRPVLVVEYLSDRKVADDARRKLAAHGFISYFAPRDLGRLNVEF